MSLTREQFAKFESLLMQIAGGITVTVGEVEVKNDTGNPIPTDITKLNSVAIAMGAGASNTGTQRVVTATDSTIATVAAVTAITNALPAGTNLLGKVGIDQVTANANEVVVKSGTVTTVSTLTSGNVGGFTTLSSSTLVMSAAGVYSTGEYMGTTTTPQSFASSVRTSGGTGVIKSILISDKITNTNVAMELWIIDRTFTAPTDNTAWDLSDANMLFVQAVIPITTNGWYASSAGQVYFDGSLSYPIKPSTGTALFYALVARGTTPSFTSSDLTITLGILMD